MIFKTSTLSISNNSTYSRSYLRSNNLQQASVRPGHPMLLYIVPLLAALSCTVALQDATTTTDNMSRCLTLDVAGSSECLGVDRAGSFNNDHENKPKADLAVAREHGGVDTETTVSVQEKPSSGGVLDSPVPMLPTAESLLQWKAAQSSQQATELLVSSWNDLRTWTKRNDTSSACEQDVERAITGFIANEMWALQMFDAWAKPGPSLLQGRSSFLGNYYQCRDTKAPSAAKRAGFKGNYCVVDSVNLTNTYNSDMFVMMALSRVQLGACIPDTCSEEEITRLFQEKLEKLNAASYVQAISTDCRTEDREWTNFTMAAILIVLVIGSLTFLGTVLDVALVYFTHCSKSSVDEKQETVVQDKPSVGEKQETVVQDKLSVGEKQETIVQDKSSSREKDSKVVQDNLHKGVWVKVLLSFSAYKNGRRLLSTSKAPGSITIIPAIRFLTMSWILTGHTFYIFVIGHATNIAQGTDEVTRSKLLDLLISAYLGVDSFFTISGFLVSYMKIQQVTSKGWRFNWRHFYLHRYWRLTPTLLVTLVLVQGFQRFAVSGSAAATLQPSDKTECENNWWLIPLYINNMFRVKMGEVCFIQSWSLAADFQFYLLCPLMMIPFYYHKLAGILSCLFFVIGQWIIAGVLSYQTNGGIGMTKISIEWLRYYYFPFYSRIGPFAIGMLSGYILSANNGRVQMKPSAVITGWIVATTAATTLIFGFHGDLSRESPSSLLVASIFNAVSRSVWSAIVCWVIIACSSGYGGPVNTFLAWPPFTTLGRLTYIGYLTQLSVSTIIVENLEQSTYLNVSSLVVFGTVTIFYTCVVSAVLVVCVEYPTFNLEKVFRCKYKE